MAIKVGGTTVVDDSRGLQNITNLKTVNGESILGTGNIATVTSTNIIAALGYTPADAAVLGDIEAALAAINGAV